MNAITHSLRADLLRLRKWPAVWVTLGSWLFLALLFGYVFNYVTYKTGGGNFSNKGQRLSDIYAELLPRALPSVLVQGMPMFGGALMLVLGAMVAGNGYGYGTWKTIYTQGPSRSFVTLGSLAALTVFVVGVLLMTLALFSVCSVGIALTEGETFQGPALGELARAFGGGLLVLEMWALAGYFLGTVARGPALSVGLGLVWALVIEQLLRGVGSLGVFVLEFFYTAIVGAVIGVVMAIVTLYLRKQLGRLSTFSWRTSSLPTSGFS